MENSYLRQQMLNAGGPLQLSNVLAVGDEPSEDGDERVLLHKYMAENEALRIENATMHHMREMLVRDHELVCRENERLVKKLDALEKNSTPQRPPAAAEKAQESVKLQTGARADTKVAKNSAAPNRSSTRESPKLSPTVRKIGRSLNDIGGSTLVAQQRGVEQGGRRNSWGTSGIPKLRQRLSTNPLVAALAQPKRVLRRTASNRVTPADTKRSSASQTGMN